MKAKYLVFFILGVVVPLSQFVPWLLAHGLDARLFVSELFANRISAFFGADVIVSALVVLALIREEQQHGMRKAWLPAAATLLIGVSAGLPLLLYMRRNARAQA